MTEHRRLYYTMTASGTRRLRALAAMKLILCFSMVVALLNKGANNDVVVMLQCSIVFALLPLAVATAGVPKHSIRALVLVLAVITGIFAWAVIQNIPLPGAENGAWANLAPWLPDLPAVASVSPGDDFNAFLKIALPLGIFMLILVLFSTDEDAYFVIQTVVTGGTILAVASILQFSMFPNTLIMDAKNYYLDSVTGPFINRNTAATFFGLIFLLSLPLVTRSLERINLGQLVIAGLSNRSFSNDERRALRRLALVTFMTATSLLTLLLTQSRAGIASTMVGLLGFILLRWLKRDQSRDPQIWKTRSKRIFCLAAVLIAMLVIIPSLAERVVYRYSVSGLDDARFCVWPGMLAAARDNLPLGTGLGSFSIVFPRYRSSDCGITYYWDKAHNFYLEGFVAIGLLFPILVFVSISALLGFFFAGRRRRKSFSIAGDTGIAVTLLVALHSAWDFSLQIPGFSMVLSVALAALTTLSLRPSRSRTNGPSNDSSAAASSE